MSLNSAVTWVHGKWEIKRWARGLTTLPHALIFLHITITIQYSTAAFINFINQYHSDRTKEALFGDSMIFFMEIAISECKKPLSANAFFVHNKDRYCTQDYQRLFGTKCVACDKYVEGQVVTVLGKTYHQDCIVCTKCRSVSLAICLTLINSNQIKSKLLISLIKTNQI